MSKSRAKEQIGRLKRGLEKLSAHHARAMSQLLPSVSPQRRQLYTKRAAILERRIRRLDEILEELRKLESESNQIDVLLKLSRKLPR